MNPQLLQTIPASVKYRFYGNSDNDGIIVCASILDREHMKLHCALSLAPAFSFNHEKEVYESVKFDKAFSKVVALYRLAVMLGFNEESALFREHIVPGLERCRTRVIKTRKRVKHSVEEYQRRRAEGRNAGYYTTTVEFYQLSDFRIGSEFAFSLDIADEADINHSKLDSEILKHIENNFDGDKSGRLPEWVLDVVYDVQDTLSGGQHEHASAGEDVEEADVDVDDDEDPNPDVDEDEEDDEDSDDEEEDEDDEDELIAGVIFDSPRLVFEENEISTDPDHVPVTDGRCFFVQDHLRDNEKYSITCSPMFENKEAAYAFTKALASVAV